MLKTLALVLCVLLPSMKAVSPVIGKRSHVHRSALLERLLGKNGFRQKEVLVEENIYTFFQLVINFFLSFFTKPFRVVILSENVPPRTSV